MRPSAFADRPFDSLRGTARSRASPRRSGARMPADELPPESPRGALTDVSLPDEPDDDEEADPPDEPPDPPDGRAAADPVVLPFEGRDGSGRSFAWRAQAGLTVRVSAAAVQSVIARRVMGGS
ncbi:MAG: hypothetical protein ABIQ52_00035 [Vicinamibacterales bacterium]